MGLDFAILESGTEPTCCHAQFMDPQLHGLLGARASGQLVQREHE